MAQQLTDNYAHLPEGQAFPPVIELLSVDSTNNYAFSLLKPERLTERQGAIPHGLAVFAHDQYAGKGQRGKTWLSNKGENIHLSVMLEPKALSLQLQFHLVAVVALAVRSFLANLSHSDIFIKWPNDMYFQDRKAGGILIENIITGNEWKWAVAGIGLNINQSHFEGALFKKAVSLKQITGKDFNCYELAIALRDEILMAYEDLCRTGKDVISLYNQFLFKKDEKVLLQKEGNIFEAVVKEVLPNGQLVVQTDTELRFHFGEISWVI
ncbi:MAG: biotin--[acetyl-CoA-carboxylase] ligase [Niabella sp.]